MGFYGYSFIFDGESSEKYGLYIYNIGNSGDKSSQGGTKLSLHTDRTGKSTKTNLLGVTEDEVLSFDLTFGSFKPLTRFDVSVIQRWLFGHRGYKKLQIVQDDMKDYYYNCILSDSEIINIGNVPYAFTCKVTCDSPFAWEDTIEYKYMDRNIVHYNLSDVNDYTYPVIEIKSTSSSNTIAITNKSNGNRITELTGLNNGEIITLFPETGIIKSSTGLKRLDKFNKKWLELVPNKNELAITGNFEYMKMIYANARRIGG